MPYIPALDDPFMQQWLPAPLIDALRQPAPETAVFADACGCLDAALRALASFVPPPVLEARMARPEHGRINGMTLSGSLLCADLSGFTTLSTRLAEAGRQGSEEISAIINQLFGVLLAEIHAHGGGLLQFGGDALTAFFDADRLGPAHTGLAGAAALALQTCMADFAAVETSCGSFPLRLRVAVHSGEVYAVEVGDTIHTHLLTTGRALHEVVVAQEYAAPGEVLISAAALHDLGSADVELKQGNLYRLRRVAVPTLPQAPVQPWQYGLPDAPALESLIARVNALRPYLLPQLSQRYLDTPAMGGEFRPVTVLFAGFFPFDRLLALLQCIQTTTNNAMIVGEILHTYFLHIQQTFRQYGGNISKIDMANLGNRLMAVFGAPTASEDDPERAVRTALDLPAALAAATCAVEQVVSERLGASPGQPFLSGMAGAVPHRVGIASGVVFAGLVGLAERREYTLMGPTVNLSARLLAAARDSTTLITEPIARQTQHLAVLHTPPPLALKGFDNPVPICQLLWKRSSEPRVDAWHEAVPLAGRAAELQRLIEGAQQAIQPEGGGRVVAVTGEAGIGKSRLADEALAALADAQPALLVVRATCQSYEQHLPYAVIARILRRMLGVRPGDPQTQADTVQQQIADYAPAWSQFVPLLGPVLDLPLAESAVTRALPPQLRRQRLDDLIVTICRVSARRQPLALVIDDLHWADASSVLVIERLAPQVAGLPLLLLLLYRRVPEMAESWREEEHGEIIELGELESEANQALLWALLGGEPPLEVHPILERSYGTPFFLIQTMRYLTDTGILERGQNGSWVCNRSVDSTTVPSRIEQLIVARLDQLGGEARTLLNVAAVIGQQLDGRLLHALPTCHRLTEERVSELLRAELLIPYGNRQGFGYRFRHALIRDVAYDSLLFAHRRALHGEVAATMEQVYGPSVERQRAVLAQHWLQADQPDRAFPHFLLAAQKAHASYANREALALYNLAVATAPWRDQPDHPPDPAAAAAISTSIGDVQALIGEYDTARQSYRRGLALLERAPETLIRCATLERKIGGSYEHQGILDQALDWLLCAAARIVDAPRTVEATLERGHIFSDMGWVHFRRGDLDTAQHELEYALATFDQAGHDDERSHVLNRLGGVAWQRGNLAQAQHAVEQSLAASERSGDLVQQAKALNNLCLIAGGRGLVGEASAYGYRAIELNELTGNQRDLAVAAINVGCLLYDHGQYPQALQRFTQAHDQAVDVHDIYHQLLALRNIGRVLAALDRLQEAEPAVRQSLTLAVRLRLPVELLESRVLLAEFALDRHDLATALREYKQAARLVSEGENEEFGRFQRLKARIALAQGDHTHAINLLVANEALFHRLQNASEIERTRTLLAQARQQRHRMELVA